MARTVATESAWAVVRGCVGASGGLHAAADSSLYPHIWTRDVGFAALGLVAATSSPGDLEPVRQSLLLLAKAQSELGRLPLKVDDRGNEVRENSAGIDAGPWFAIANAALADRGIVDTELSQAAERGLEWTAHLDVDGTGLIVSPESGDWADMMPFRHHVLYTNVVYLIACRAHARLSEDRDRWIRRAEVLGRAIELRFTVDGVEADEHQRRARRLATVHPEWERTYRYLGRWGQLPYLLPYVGFRQSSNRFDVVGNSLAVLAGIGGEGRGRAVVDYAEAVGVASPVPAKTLYPPIESGDPDFRDLLNWRNLCQPHHYQNGGAWPFTGALYTCMMVDRGRAERASQLLGELERAAVESDYGEWMHGLTGASMGESRQLWSAAGLLWAEHAVRGGQVYLPGRSL
ncbi:MAG: hypothetical protein KJO07_15500 [Deltaproteobacteria bacterium]|nr:hypothetical protein [Deltaproteobacteria bacterium]